MRIVVEAELCEAHGDCVLEAPEVFDLDDTDNWVILLQESPAPELHEKVREAARLCPVGAIRIEE